MRSEHFTLRISNASDNMFVLITCRCIVKRTYHGTERGTDIHTYKQVLIDIWAQTFTYILRGGRTDGHVRKTRKPADRQTDRQADRQADRQTDGRTDANQPLVRPCLSKERLH